MRPTLKPEERDGAFTKETESRGTSLVVQWPRLQVPNAAELGLIPGQGTRSHMLQLGPQCHQINK